MYHVLTCSKWINGSGWAYGDEIVEKYEAEPLTDKDGKLIPDIDWSNVIDIGSMSDEYLAKLADEAEDEEYKVTVWQSEEDYINDEKPVCEEKIWVSELAQQEQDDRAIEKIKTDYDYYKGEEIDENDITINECRNGRRVAWYRTDDGQDEMCIYVDTFEELDEEEIVEQLPVTPDDAKIIEKIVTCTEKDAKRHINNGSLVIEYSDYEKSKDTEDYNWIELDSEEVYIGEYAGTKYIVVIVL